MRVDPAEPEGRHRRRARLADALGPGARRREHRQPRRRQIRVRRRLLEARRRGQGPRLEGQQDLHQARRARAGEQVPDVGLHGADHHVGVDPVQQPPERPQLHRVSPQRARAVALHQVHVRGAHVEAHVRRAHRPQLPLALGGQQAAAHVVGQAGASQDRADPIPVLQRPVEALEHEHAGPLAHHQAVGPGVERRADPRRRERAELAEPDLGVETVRAGGAAREDRVQATGAQLLAGEVDRVQRRRARRVERERAAPEAEDPRQERRGQPRDVSVQGVRSEAVVRRGGRRGPEDPLLEGAPQHGAGDGGGPVRGEGDVGEDHAHPFGVRHRAAEVRPGVGPDPEDEAIEGIEAVQARRRDAGGLHPIAEVVDVEGGQEARPRRHHPVGHAVSAREQARHVRVRSLRRDRRARAAGVQDHPPERLEVGRTGEESGRADDGDGGGGRQAITLRPALPARTSRARTRGRASPRRCRRTPRGAPRGCRPRRPGPRR